ncbi:sensor histidine kinase [candidate division KSB1 bacterium]
MQYTLQRRLTNLLFIFGIFTLISLFFTGETYFYYLLEGKPVSFWINLRWSVVNWLLWALLSLLIIRLARVLPIDFKNWYYTVPVHLVLALLFAALHAFFFHIYAMTVQSGPVWDMHLILVQMIKEIVFSMFVYWIVIGICFLTDYYRKNREHELKTSQMETKLAHAQLEVLKMQLHPHFLFNTLHAISALVKKDPASADKMIGRLGDLLRMTLERSGEQEIPLKEELEFLKLYLEIEKTRFQDRLNINLDIDNNTLDCIVPNLILQPLVENAIKHGIAKRSSGGGINIKTESVNDRLRLTIIDNGTGLQENNGLSNTRARLNQLYGDKHVFAISNSQTGGVNVTLEVPCRKDNIDNSVSES